MDETPHLVAHFMAVGAEKRLEDYHFLRNTYETISGQEIQLNRILRMLGEDEFTLNWRTALLPIGRARSRSVYEFDRWNNALVLQGSIAYERLRDLEYDNSKHAREITIPSSSRRVQELRERRQRLSEQREYAPLGTGDRSGTPSSARLRALAEYDTALATSETKRQRQAEENRLNTSKNEEKELTERRREKFKITFDDEDQKYGKSKQQEDESSNRFTKTSRSNGEKDKNTRRGQENDPDNAELKQQENKSSNRFEKTTRSNGERDENERRGQRKDSDNAESKQQEDESSNRLTKTARSNEEKEKNARRDQEKDSDNAELKQQENKRSNRFEKTAPSNEEKDKNARRSQENDSDNAESKQQEDGPSNRSTKTARSNEDKDKNGTRYGENDSDNAQSKQQEGEPSNHSTKTARSNEEKHKNVTNGQENDSDNVESKQQEDEPSNRPTKTAHSNEEKDKNARRDREKDSDKVRKSSTKYDQDESGDIELASFKVRYETVPSSKANQDEENPSIRLLCQWASPNASSAIDYFTIERQLGDEEWLPIGEKIDNLKNKTELDISSPKDADHKMKTNIPSYFRLKAHLRNGQTCTSKPTDEIFINLSQEKNIIIPDVKILSPSSVRLTWNDNENENEEKSNIYNIEKKEEEQPEWEKLIEVPLSQHSARINSLTDAKQCQFRLTPSSSEPDEITTTENEVEPEVLTVNNVNEWLNSLHIVPTSSTTVDIDISEEGFKEYDCYKIEYTTIDQLSQWKQMSNITHDDSHLTIDKLKQGTDYKFRFTPVLSGATTPKNETNSSQLSLILDVKMPSTRRGRFTANESTSPIPTSPQFSNSEVFAGNEIASIATTPSKLSLQEVVDENESETPVATSPQFSFKKNADDNESETSGAKSSQSSLPKGEDETASPTGTSSQFSYKKDVDEDESVTPVAASSQNDDDENETPVSAPPQFTIQKLDSTSVLIEAIVPEEEPATFEDVYDVYSKKETIDDDWTKVGTIDKEHLSTTVDNLEENTAYNFKIDNITSPADDDQSNTVQEFEFDTTPVKQYDPTLFLEKIEESLENVVNGVMQAAAGHQILDEPVNKSLNEVIKEVFRDEALVPSEKYGFDTLALNNDLQIYRGPKQMMLKDLEIDETIDSSKQYGEIIIHNYRTSHQSVIVREENGNTRVGNIDGDIIIRNVVSDVLLKNEKAHHELSMNIVGQAFLKGVQGTLIASKFRGIIVVKNVNKP